MSKRMQAEIYGRVQRVGFRSFVWRVASSLDVSGFVCNSDSGAVEVTAEGDPRDLATLLDYLSEGPSGAHVDRVDVSWAEPTGEYDKFGVKT